MRRVNKLVLAAGFLALLHLAAILAGFLAPYDYAAQDRSRPYAPPAHVHWGDCQGKWHVRPFVYATAVREAPVEGPADDQLIHIARPERWLLQQQAAPARSLGHRAAFSRLACI